MTVGVLMVGLRFIPACAGNAVSAASAAVNATVHPRVCGERAGPSDIDGWSAGSSPRVRGTLETPTLTLHDTRFIPACAGNAM